MHLRNAYLMVQMLTCALKKVTVYLEKISPFRFTDLLLKKKFTLSNKTVSLQDHSSFREN